MTPHAPHYPSNISGSRATLTLIPILSWHLSNKPKLKTRKTKTMKKFHLSSCFPDRSSTWHFFLFHFIFRHRTSRLFSINQPFNQFMVLKNLHTWMNMWRIINVTNELTNVLRMLLSMPQLQISSDMIHHSLLAKYRKPNLKLDMTSFARTAQPRTNFISAGNTLARHQHWILNCSARLHCTYCGGTLEDNYPALAMAVAILLFPVGIICCCHMKEKQCVICNRSFS